MKHSKHSMLTHFSTVEPADVETLDNWDDRTLSHLVGTRPGPLSDGHDNDNPYRELPLERWRDRVLAKWESGGSR